MRIPRIRPETFSRITLAAVVTLSLIIVTGAAVRLTDSGLGCPDWPTCAQHQVVAPWQYHAVIEFANRLFTVAVLLSVLVAVLGSLARAPRRADLVRLSLGLVVGVLAQIVLGGLTVIFKLAPPLVMAHLLLSLAVLWVGLVLHHRAGQPESAPRRVVGRESFLLGRILLLGVGIVVVLGTVVTGSGPHSGSNHASRLSFPFHSAAELHATAVMLVIGLTLGALFALHQGGAPPTVQRRARLLLEVMVAQAAVGYAQYFTRVPAFLVGIHVAGATAVWIATVELNLAFHLRPAARLTDSASSGPLVATG